jgi:hypothetical protein
MDVFLKTDDGLVEDQKFWRYMDLAKFVSMLEQKALWLARADAFRDRHEGRFPDDMRRLIEKSYEGFDDDDDSPVKDADDFQDYLVKNTFISCWHENLDENMVMWEIYGRDNNALAVQTTVGRISRSISTSGITGHSLLLKKVAYQKASEISGNLLYEDCFFIKRPHFFFEKEVRVSLDTYSRMNPSKNTPHGHKLPANINELVETVMVHPDSSEWFVNVVNSIVKKYKINAQVVRGAYGTK